MKQAAEALAESSEKLDDLREAQAFLLREAGLHQSAGRDQNGPCSGEFGDGLARVAEQLDRQRESMVETPARDILAAGFNVSPGSGLTAPAVMTPFMPKAQPRQFLFTSFPAGNVEDGELAITEWRQTGSRTVTGTVLRDPVSVAEKAKVELSIALQTPSLKQVAIVAREIPNQLFLSVDLFEQWLLNELTYQLQLGVEAHCLAQIGAATPPHGWEGTTLIEQIRHGVAEMKRPARPRASWRCRLKTPSRSTSRRRRARASTCSLRAIRERQARSTAATSSKSRG